MKNADLIKSFINGATSGKTGHLTIQGNKLINYYTVIAVRTENKFYLNNKHYSKTTTINQNKLRYYIPSLQLVEISEQEINKIA